MALARRVVLASDAGPDDLAGLDAVPAPLVRVELRQVGGQGVELEPTVSRGNERPGGLGAVGGMAAGDRSIEDLALLSDAAVRTSRCASDLLECPTQTRNVLSSLCTYLGIKEERRYLDGGLHVHRLRVLLCPSAVACELLLEFVDTAAQPHGIVGFDSFERLDHAPVKQLVGHRRIPGGPIRPSAHFGGARAIEGPAGAEAHFGELIEPTGKCHRDSSLGTHLRFGLGGFGRCQAHAVTSPLPARVSLASPIRLETAALLAGLLP
jgi:hypothetical protein